MIYDCCRDHNDITTDLQPYILAESTAERSTEPRQFHHTSDEHFNRRLRYVSVCKAVGCFDITYSKYFSRY